MKALVRTKPGKEFSTMKIQDLPIPQVKPNELKIKMVSSRINHVDMDLMKGFPTLKYKTPQIGGIDGAGIVIETGSDVSNFVVGDSVVFYRLFSDIGTWAEIITIPARYCAKITNKIDTKIAGAIALPLLTAFDSLLQLEAKKGEKILIHGAGGGVGFQALQIAKIMGLYVVGTGSALDRPDLDKVGIDKFIDYKKQDFSNVLNEKEVDYVFDTLGDDILKKSILLKPKKIVSIKYVETSQMHKTGVNLPVILRWLMNLMMGKFKNLAKRNSVELIGQITGANGNLMQQAIDLIYSSYVAKEFAYINFLEIDINKLNINSIGKIISFTD